MWNESVVMMIVIISLWAQCICTITGDRKMLTSKQFLLIFIEKKVQGTGKTDIRLPQTNKRFCSKVRLKERLQIIVVIFIWSTYNFGQNAEKMTKLSKIAFPMECFTDDFLQFFTKKSQNLAFGWTAGQSPSNPSISETSLKFRNFFSLKSFGNS